MADFSSPVRIPRPAFEQLLARVDDAVARFDAALLLHEDYPYDVDLVKEAAERVGHVRSNMPNLSKLWREKSNSVMRPLVELAYETTTSASGSLGASLYLAAARIDTSEGVPDKSDITRLRVQLWPADVRILMRELEHLWHAHLSAESLDEDGEPGAG
ncbi:MAG TPA: hypothetical protein VMA95_21060 [Streptosporangiaceae bacterium]|nr:hypothetical protein [Streptosporangiaceae bacterium]